MRILYRRSLLLLLYFHISACAKRGSKPPKGSPIIPGDIADDDEFPYIVSIRNKLSPYEHDGGGTIIRSNWILTSRHLLLDMYIQNQTHFPTYFAFTNLNLPVVFPKYSNNLSEFWQKPFHDAEKVFCYPLSDDVLVYPTDSDIALIKLRDPIPIGDGAYDFQNIQYPNIPIGLKRRSKIKVGGWGRYRNDSPDMSELLRETHLYTQTLATCTRSILNFRPSQQICVYNQNADICNGDSGGPGVLPTAGGGETQVAIISYTNADCDEIAIMEDVGYYHDWIEYVVHTEDEGYSCKNLVGKGYNIHLPH